MHILVVDDNRLLNRFLTTFLRQKGNIVASLTNPTKVIDWLGHNQCDLIILDIGMPQIDGITLLRDYIRPKYPNVVVIIFTGLGYDEDAMNDCKKAGSNGYVSKGVGATELYKGITRVFSERGIRVA